MQKTALITGASGGIGKDLAYELAKDHVNLVLVARSEDKLAELATQLHTKYGIDVKVIAKNLEEMASIQEIHEELKESGIHVDYLVNNAGFGLFGNFHETNPETELRMIDLNIKALMYLTKLFLPDMIERKSGGILNVASTASFQPGPLMSVYFATKAFVLSFSEALENELKSYGIRVTALCPGPTHTGFSDRADLEQSKLFRNGVMDSPTVAAIGYQGFKKGKRIVIPGIKNWIMATSVRWLPRKWVPSIVRKVQERV